MTGYSNGGTYAAILTVVLGVTAACGASLAIPCDHPNFGLSPYTWKASEKELVFATRTTRI